MREFKKMEESPLPTIGSNRASAKAGIFGIAGTAAKQTVYFLAPLFEGKDMASKQLTGYMWTNLANPVENYYKFSTMKEAIEWFLDMGKQVCRVLEVRNNNDLVKLITDIW